MKTCFSTFFAILAVVPFLVFAAGNGPPARENEFDGKNLDSIRKQAEQGSPEAQYYLGLKYEKENDMEEAAKWYRKAAEHNDLDAQYKLAVCYDRGEGVRPDSEEAVKWYRKAAENGILEAQFGLADCCEKGRGTARNIQDAVKWYREAAKRKDPRAQFRLGYCYETYSEVQNYDDAAIWYRRAAEGGDAEAQYKLGLFYEKGTGVEKNIPEAISWYAEAAKRKHLDALLGLGRCYEQGAERVPRNMETAARMYWRAVEQGYRDPQLLIRFGSMFESGKELKPDMAEAVRWYVEAVEQGTSDAQLFYRIGSCYEKGDGSGKNMPEAVRWYAKAADQGYVDARLFYRIGLCFEKGNGLDKDTSEAAKWFLKAAENGHAEASQKLDSYELISNALSGDAESQFKLAQAYETGKGAAKDMAEAVKWYVKASEQGYGDAQSFYRLGSFYENGEGVGKDMAEAVKWYRKAAGLGYEDAAFFYKTGSFYEKGEGFEKDMAEAVKWYRKAADLGYPRASTKLESLKLFSNALDGDAESQFKLALACETGQGVEKDLNEAAKWCRRAAEQGHAGAIAKLELLETIRKAQNGDVEAQYQLGLVYETGDGVKQDLNEALKWYITASGHGHAGATTKKEALSKSVGELSLLVTTGRDVVDPNDSETSLREAMNYACSHQGSDSVRFADDFVIRLSSPLDITNSFSIDGEEHQITIVGPGRNSMFSVSNYNVSITLRNLSLISDLNGGDNAGILDITTFYSSGYFRWFFDKGISRRPVQWVELDSVKDGGKAQKLWQFGCFGVILNGSSHLHRLSAINGATVNIGPDSILESSTITGVSGRADGDFIVEGTLKDSIVLGFGDVHVSEGGICENLTVMKNGFVENGDGGTIRGVKLDFGSVYGYGADNVLTGKASFCGIASMKPSEVGKMAPTVGKETDIVFDLRPRTPKSGFSFSPHSGSTNNYPKSGQPHMILDYFLPFKGARSYTVRVTENQPTGEYLLVGQADEFKSRMSLEIGDTTHSDVLSLGKKVTVGSKSFSLALNDAKTLTLTIRQK